MYYIFIRAKAGSIGIAQIIIIIIIVIPWNVPHQWCRRCGTFHRYTRKFDPLPKTQPEASHLVFLCCSSHFNNTPAMKQLWHVWRMRACLWFLHFKLNLHLLSPCFGEITADFSITPNQISKFSKSWHWRNCGSVLAHHSHIFNLVLKIVDLKLLFTVFYLF